MNIVALYLILAATQNFQAQYSQLKFQFLKRIVLFGYPAHNKPGHTATTQDDSSNRKRLQQLWISFLISFRTYCHIFLLRCDYPFFSIGLSRFLSTSFVGLLIEAVSKRFPKFILRWHDGILSRPWESFMLQSWIQDACYISHCSLVRIFGVPFCIEIKTRELEHKHCRLLCCKPVSLWRYWYTCAIGKDISLNINTFVGTIDYDTFEIWILPFNIKLFSVEVKATDYQAALSDRYTVLSAGLLTFVMFCSSPVETTLHKVLLS